MEQEFPTLPEHLGWPRILVRFVLLDLEFIVYVLYIVACPFLFWPLFCQSFFDLRILITPLGSSSSSYSNLNIMITTDIKSYSYIVYVLVLNT